MKKLLFALIILVGCQSRQENKKNNFNNFRDYASNLEIIQLPFTYSTNFGITSPLPSLDTNLLNNYKNFFKNLDYEKTLGKLVETENYVIVIEKKVGDFGPVPIFLTYDNTGKIIESFNTFKKSGVDFGYNSSEYITVNKDYTITVIDSTRVWKINSDETDIIEGSDSLNVGKTIYKIDSLGIYRKQ